MTQVPSTTTNAGAPVASDAHSLDRRHRRPDRAARPLPRREARAVQPRARPRARRARQGRRRVRHVHARRTTSAPTPGPRCSSPAPRPRCCARFSTVAGEQGSPDTWRDPRGFALKFYTTEGNYDLVGNNTPVFFIRDGIKFPDFIHSQKRLPGSHLRDNDMQWDFWTLSPESAHQVTWLMGDRGIPALVAPHGRLRLAHLPVDQRGRRAVLGQVPLHDEPGHPTT